MLTKEEILNSGRFTEDDLIICADCLDEYGEYTSMALLGYSAEDLREMAQILEDRKNKKLLAADSGIIQASSEYVENLVNRLKQLEEALPSHSGEKKPDGVLLLSEIAETLEGFKQRYLNGVNARYQGDDADDAIICPICGCEVARNDDYEEMKPHYCPDCGTKLIY